MKTTHLLTPFLLRLGQKINGMRLAHFVARTDRALVGGSTLAVCPVERTQDRAPARTRTHHLLVQATIMLCAATALVGCASTDRGVSTPSFNEQILQPVAAPASPALPQHAVLHERALQKLDLNGDGAITLDEWKQFDTSAAAKEHFNALDDDGDGQINVTEFLTQAPKHSERYHFFGDTDKTDDSFVSSDEDALQNPGWHLFSFHF